MSRADVRAALRDAKPTLLDRAISVVAPVWAAERQRARMFMALAGGYTGASRSRRQTKEWSHTRGNSADADILTDLPDLRDRSRDLVRNEPIATGAISSIVTNVIGTGLALQSRVDREILGMSEDQAEAWQKKAEREFRLWAESTDCDATRTLDFYGMQALVVRSALESGDVFATTPMRPSSGIQPYGLCLQIFEADQVSNPDGKMDSPELAGGIGLDSYGAPTSYHFMKTHPGALRQAKREWQEIPAFGEKTRRRQVIHVYEKLRPGQTRGVPLLAPVIETLKMLSRYTEAELMAAVISGMFTVFVESERGGLELNDPSGIGQEVGASGSDKDLKLGVGAVLDLSPGEKVSFANPMRPSAGFDGFVMSLSRFVGIAIEVPYEVLVKHFSSSYTAARGALLEAWKMYRRRRAWTAQMFCDPVYELWMDLAVSMGRIAAPGYFDDPIIRRAYLGAEWVGDGPISVDPLKDINAVEKRINVGVSTLQKESALHDGGDWKGNLEQLGRERKLRTSMGLNSETVSDPTNPEPFQPGNPEDEDDEDAEARRQLQQVNQALIAATVKLLDREPPQAVAPAVTLAEGAIKIQQPVHEGTVDALTAAVQDVGRVAESVATAAAAVQAEQRASGLAFTRIERGLSHLTELTRADRVPVFNEAGRIIRTRLDLPSET